MNKSELLQETLELLNSESEHLSEAGHARFVALLTKDVTDDVPPEPQTDMRWHEYALAAVGAFGHSLVHNDAELAPLEAGEAAAKFAATVADGLLAAAKERAK